MSVEQQQKYLLGGIISFDDGTKDKKVRKFFWIEHI